MSEQAYRVSICNRSMDGATHLQFSCDFFFTFYEPIIGEKMHFFVNQTSWTFIKDETVPIKKLKVNQFQRDFLVSLMLLKKRTIKFHLTAMIPQVDLFFLEECEDTKLTDLYEHFICTANCTLSIVHSAKNTIVSIEECQANTLKVIWKYFGSLSQ